jgi:hypothetical protein
MHIVTVKQNTIVQFPPYDSRDTTGCSSKDGLVPARIQKVEPVINYAGKMCCI